jgi:radical SAM protein with 4Fe4S-binding SPASM domain
MIFSGNLQRQALLTMSPDSPPPSAKLFELTRTGNIPLICTFELTQRCNFRCVHCYIDHADPSQRRELSTGQIKRILSGLKAAGTLNLVFTGGEIFLRPDILPLCAYARKLGFDLRIFTNAVLITETDARFLGSLSLTGIEISLYGPAKIHDRVTRSPGSFDLTLQSIRLLKKYRIPVTIKTPLMTLNIAGLPWLKRFAKQANAKLRIDPILVPGNNGNRKMLKYRLGRTALRAAYRDPGIFQKPASPFVAEPELDCSAGHNLAAIGCDGTVYPCLQLLLPLGNLKRRPFSEIWNNRNRPLARYRSIAPDDIATCRSCDNAKFCQRCPGVALLEDGDLTGPSRIACTVASVIKSL